uniref:Golgin subfamily A conserved domain-containing protein n=1 Tax=Pseudonaja textilis TaxID=8673 RepID=A0A670Z6N6_PSETE
RPKPWLQTKIKYQQKNSPVSTAGAKKKRRGKEASRPETPVSDGVQSPENVSILFCHVLQCLLLPGFCFKQSMAGAGILGADVHRLQKTTEFFPLFFKKKLFCLFSLSLLFFSSSSTSGCLHVPHQARYQELAIAFDSSNLTNKQLSAEIEELVRNLTRSTDLALVHIQTIGILVSEKSELQTALSHTQQAARQKAGEAEDLAARLQSSRQRISEVEYTLSSLSLQQKQTEKHNKELAKERDNLKLEMYNKINEELKQQTSELSEKLRNLISENSAMKLDVEDLHKKLEMAELVIQQVSAQPGISDATAQQLQAALEERANLESQIAQLSESLQKLQAERDQYVLRLKEEGNIWQQRVELLSEQVRTIPVRFFGGSLMVLEVETPPAPATPGPSPTEARLQEELAQLEKEKEELLDRWQTQVRDNGQLSQLNQEQEERLQELEKALQRYSEEAVDKQQILENMQSDKATISRALTQNRELKEQLAELQNGFVKLTNENMEITSALQSEQHVKKQLAKKLGELQEKLVDFKEKMDQKTHEAQDFQDQRDQYLAHLQQYIAAYQLLTVEKEELHKKYLLQTQLMDRLQHEEVQGKVNAEMHFKELQKAKVSPAGLTSGFSFGKANREIWLARMKFPSWVMKRLHESSQVAFLTSAVSQAEGEREEIRHQLMEKKRQCRELLQQIASLKKEPTTATPAGGEGLPLRKISELRFTDLMREKAELKERVEELEHHCIQLSGETDTIGEYIALYQSQRAILKQRHREKEDYINRLAQDKEDMKMKLQELHELVMRLVGERNDWYTKYMIATQAGDPISLLPLTPPPPLFCLPDLREVSLADEAELDAVPSQPHPSHGDPQGPQPAPRDPTAQQILRLLREIQNPQNRAGPLSESPCIPFFYRVDENDEVKLLVV